MAELLADELLEVCHDGVAELSSQDGQLVSM